MEGETSLQQRDAEFTFLSAADERHHVAFTRHSH